MSLFFSKEGKHIICGGTTSTIAAKYLGKPLRPKLEFADRDIPPIAELEGADLVTEGVITMNKVIEYAKDYLGENELYEQWNFKETELLLFADYCLRKRPILTFLSAGR